jgi:hypothetical protein
MALPLLAHTCRYRYEPTQTVEHKYRAALDQQAPRAAAAQLGASHVPVTQTCPARA